MNSTYRSLFLLALAVSCATACSSLPSDGAGEADVSVSETSRLRTYEFPGSRTLVLEIPPEWKEELLRLDEQSPPTLRFTPLDDGADFSVMLHVKWPEEEKAPDNSLEGIELSVQERIEQVSRALVEQEPPLEELRGDAVHGYVYSATNSSEHLEDGEFRYLTEGRFAIGDFTVDVTILTPEPESPARERALAMIRGARQERLES